MEELIKVMHLVAKIEREIKEQDEANGTLRPLGVSRGRIYERLGIFVIAMCQAHLNPLRVLELIARMASMTEDSLDYISMVGYLQMNSDKPAVFIPQIRELRDC